MRSRLHLVPRFRYLIGTRAELRRAWAAWHVLSVRQSAQLVDHVAYTALVDPSGKERVLYGASGSRERCLARPASPDAQVDGDDLAQSEL